MTIPHLTKEQLDNFADDWRGKTRHRGIWTSAERAARALTDYEEALCNFFENVNGARLSGDDFADSFKEPRVPDEEEGHPRYHQNHHLKIEQYLGELRLFCEWCQVELWTDRFGEQERFHISDEFEGEIHAEVARQLRGRGYECDLENTGGNVYLLILGDEKGPQLWIDDCGNVVYHPDLEDPAEFEILLDGTEADPNSDEWNKKVREVVELVENGIRQGRITVRRVA